MARTNIGSVVALKQVCKQRIEKLKQVQHAKNEKQVLQEMSGQDFFPRLHCAFQDSNSLFYMMDLIPGGDICRLKRYAKEWLN